MRSVINRLYEFGDFQVDPARRLLLRNGEVITLTPKVFDTLLVLVTSNGRVMDKEELVRQVWGGLAVEEVGLTKNVSILRKALGESPDSHKYIVTVPGRGYRFVAGVKQIPEEDEEIAQPLTSPERPAVAPPPAPPSRPVSRKSLLVSLGMVLFLLASGLAVFRYIPRPALTREDTILLADFTNQTGDALFDGALKQGLAVQLEQSPFLNIFPDARVQETLQLMDLPRDQRVTPAIARQICERQGIKALCVGSIAPLGKHYVISLEAIDAKNGSTLARAQVEPESKEQVLKALSKAASGLRSKLGESLGSIQKYDALLELTTPSLEALRAYSLGYREARKGKWRDAATFYQQAVSVDPNFAYAYAGLAALYRNSKLPGLATKYASQAYALRNRVSQREKLVITSSYYEHVTGEIDKNIQELKLYREIYPRDPQGHNNLALSYAHVGQFEAAVEESRIAVKLDPNSTTRYAVLGGNLLRLGRLAEARQVFQQAQQSGFDDLAVHHGLYRLAFLDKDTVAMDREFKWAAARPNGYAAFEWQAEAEASRGQFRQSADHVRRAIDEAIRADARETAAGYAAEAALRAAAVGQCPQASALVTQAMSIQRGALSLSRSSLALALCGQTAEAHALAGELAGAYPQNTLIHAIWLPLISAATELRGGKAAPAIKLLEPAATYENAAFYWPQYLRAQAYLQLRRGPEAAAEFKKILDNPAQTVPSILHSLANRGLGRALAMANDLAGCRTAFQAFAAEWKDADGDLPPGAKNPDADSNCAPSSRH